MIHVLSLHTNYFTVLRHTSIIVLCSWKFQVCLFQLHMYSKGVGQIFTSKFPSLVKYKYFEC